jgi:predicted dehydrogenase
MLNIGVIGCGYWGAKHARVVNELENANLYAVSDFDYNKVKEITANYQVAETYDTAVDLLNNPKVDAVIIATPASSHYSLALEALEAGKHVLVEKPLSIVPQEAQHLIDVANSKKLTLMVGHTFEYHPAVHTMRDIIQSGELGDLYYMDTTRINLGLYQRDVNVIHDLCPHDISIMIYMLGERPVEISTKGYSVVHGGVVDIAYLEYRFADGFVANSRVSWLAPRKEREITIVGSKKMVVYDDVADKNPINIYEKGIRPPKETEKFTEWKFAYHYGEVTPVKIPGGEPLKIEVSHFLQCIQSGEKPLTDGINGRTVVSILNAAQLSLRDAGRPKIIEYYDALPHRKDKARKLVEVGASARNGIARVSNHAAK